VLELSAPDLLPVQFNNNRRRNASRTKRIHQTHAKNAQTYEIMCRDVGVKQTSLVCNIPTHPFCTSSRDVTICRQPPKTRFALQTLADRKKHVYTRHRGVVDENRARADRIKLVSLGDPARRSARAT